MNKHQFYLENFPVTYNLFGIYADWKIDNFIFDKAWQTLLGTCKIKKSPIIRNGDK